MKLCKIIKNENVMINDRIPDTDYASYRVYEDRYIPVIKILPNEQWEHINTIGLSWGYNKQQKKSDYKNGQELYQLYQKVREKGGRFLLNIGPDQQGNIDVNEMNSLNELKILLQKDHMLIYNYFLSFNSSWNDLSRTIIKHNTKSQNIFFV
jgi:alpha-L-fucosidase